MVKDMEAAHNIKLLTAEELNLIDIIKTMWS